MTTTRASIRPPVDRPEPADPATKNRMILRVLIAIIVTLVVVSFLVGIRW